MSGRSVFGKGPTVHGPASGGGGVLTARLLVPGPVGGVSLPDATPEKANWNESGYLDWDQLGLTLSADGKTVTFTTAGVFLVSAFVQINASGAAVNWPCWAYVGCYNSDAADVINEGATAVGSTTVAPEMSISGIHQFHAADSLSVTLWQNSGETLALVYGSLSIARLGPLP